MKHDILSTCIMGDLPFLLYQPGFVKGIKGVGQATEGKLPLEVALPKVRFNALVCCFQNAFMTFRCASNDG